MTTKRVPSGHLAGSIGQRAHVLLPYVAEWRWMHEGDCSVWYDSVRLYRQRERGQWQGVLQELSECIARERTSGG